MSTILTLLTIQGIMGAFDNFWHHELTENLTSKPSAWFELSLHSARAFIYGIVFLALGWSSWHGVFAVILAILLITEVVITLWDFLEEDMTRKLPPLERVLHTVLALNYGAVLAFLAPVLWTWAQLPTGIDYAYHGALTWIMSLYAVGIFAWSLRDGLAARRLRPLIVPEWQRRTFTPAMSKTGRMVLITGATGFIGRRVTRDLIERGDNVIVLTRDLNKAAYHFGPHARAVATLDDIAGNEPIDAIINLAGEPVMGLPWTANRRATIMASRIGTTDAVLDLVRRLDREPEVLISASAIGYYGERGDDELTEDSGHGSGFTADLTLKWEARAGIAAAMHMRTVLLRLGVVLGTSDGAFPRLAMPARFGLGAIMGSGRQWLSWIHIDDAARLVLHALDTPALDGPVNATAPHPATAATIMRAIATELARPLFLRVPEWVLRRGLGEMSRLFLDSARVMPRKAIATGFEFHHATINIAVAGLLGTTRRRSRHGASHALTAWTGC